MKIAVIGAGASGLAATKICRDYGFHVTCFEQLDSIGGLWNYKPQSVPGQSSVAKSTTVNSSKEFMAYSDFPPSAELPNFMHHSQVLAYFEMFARHFSLRSAIKFQTEVKTVKRSEKFCENGLWDVSYLDKTTGLEITSKFDSVIIANGHHAYPFQPHFEGMEKFTGRIIHSHSYKEPSSFLDKKVLVVGVGNSGGDTAVELGHLASQVNDSLPHRIMSGAVKIRPDVRRFLDKNGAEFKDGSKIFGLDDVILCTGYSLSFPMLQRGIIDVEDNVVELYKLMYPPDLGRHPTLCVVGLVQPLGGIMPIAEMQARFHCEVLLKRIQLPDKPQMLQEILRHNDRMRRRFGGARRHTVQVDYAPYMDDLASFFGCKPSPWRFLLKGDWELAARLVFYPAFPYHYRQPPTSSPWWATGCAEIPRLLHETYLSLAECWAKVLLLAIGTEAPSTWVWTGGHLECIVSLMLAVLFSRFLKNKS